MLIDRTHHEANHDLKNREKNRRLFELNLITSLGLIKASFVGLN